MSKTTTVVSYFFIDLAGSIARFPLWWYTTGFLGAARWANAGLRYRWRGYAIGLWVRNFLVPMYGQYDWTGRLISVLVRFAVIVGRLIAFTAEAIAYGILIIFYLAAPPLFFLFALASSISR